MSLCLEAYIHILGFSKAYTLILKKQKTKTKKKNPKNPKKTDLYDLNFVEKNDLKSRDEPTESGLCTMFLISGDVF